jgi:hypothetical protein
MLSNPDKVLIELLWSFARVPEKPGGMWKVCGRYVEGM